jgi:hypothetical protein
VTYDDAVTVLRGWCGERVVVELAPEESRMEGELAELDPAGVDGALFAVDREERSGVAVALFRDGVDHVRHEGDELVIGQGRVTVTVTRVR